MEWEDLTNLEVITLILHHIYLYFLVKSFYSNKFYIPPKKFRKCVNEKENLWQKRGWGKELQRLEKKREKRERESSKCREKMRGGLIRTNHLVLPPPSPDPPTLKGMIPLDQQTLQSNTPNIRYKDVFPPPPIPSNYTKTSYLDTRRKGRPPRKENDYKLEKYLKVHEGKERRWFLWMVLIAKYGNGISTI